MPDDTRDRGLHRHGDPDPDKWDEAEAVTGRPNDLGNRGTDKPALPNSTLASRAKARTDEKQVDAEQVEDRAVKKAPAKKAAARKG